MILLRSIQVAIVLFWLVMTAWLVRMVWTPGLTEVAPELVLERFFSRRAPSELHVLDRGRRIGSLTVSPIPLASERGDFPGAVAGILMAGFLEFPDRGDAERDARMRFVSRLFLGAEREIAGLKLDLRSPASPHTVQIVVERKDRPAARHADDEEERSSAAPRGSDLPVRFRLYQNEVLAFDSAMFSADAGAGSLPGAGFGGGLAALQAAALLQAWGIDPAALAASPDGADSVFGMVKAMEGEVVIRDHRFSAFVLELPIHGALQVRFFLTQAGELVRVEGPWSYEIVSDIFYPELGLIEGPEG